MSLERVSARIWLLLLRSKVSPSSRLLVVYDETDENGKAFVCREVLENFFWPGREYSQRRHIIITTCLVFSAMTGPSPPTLVDRSLADS